MESIQQPLTRQNKWFLSFWKCHIYQLFYYRIFQRYPQNLTLNKESEGKITEQDIIDYLKDKVKPYAVPKYVEFRDDLPLTLAMKLFKRKLKTEEIAKMKERGEIK